MMVVVGYRISFSAAALGGAPRPARLGAPWFVVFVVGGSQSVPLRRSYIDHPWSLFRLHVCRERFRVLAVRSCASCSCGPVVMCRALLLGTSD